MHNTDIIWLHYSIFSEDMDKVR